MHGRLNRLNMCRYVVLHVLVGRPYYTCYYMCRCVVLHVLVGRPYYTCYYMWSCNNCHCFVQLSGLGKLRPNTVVIGFKRNWTTCPQEEVEEYVSILQ